MSEDPKEQWEKSPFGGQARNLPGLASGSRPRPALVSVFHASQESSYACGEVDCLTGGGPLP